MTSRNPISKDQTAAKEIPDVITDTNTKRTYERGKFLGKVRAFDNRPVCLRSLWWHKSGTIMFNLFIYLFIYLFFSLKGI